MNHEFEIRDIKVVSNNSIRAISYNVFLVEGGKELYVGNFCKFGLSHNSPQELVNYAVCVGYSYSSSPYPRKPASYC